MRTRQTRRICPFLLPLLDQHYWLVRTDTLDADIRRLVDGLALRFDRSP
ncbi:hypothetical protein NKG94_07795 [Micromonospora sp. M12]